MGCKNSTVDSTDKNDLNTDNNQRIIAVLGSTGQQGGAVMRKLIESQQFIVRAISRNEEKLDKLKEAWPQIQTAVADIDDVESLEKAFNGAYGVFALTNFWEHFSGSKEKDQAEKIAKACRQCETKHIVWSTLEDTRPLMKNSSQALEGDYNVPHFDGKNEGNVFFDGLPTTFLYTSFYYQNFITFGMGPQKLEGKDCYQITFNTGDEKMPLVDVEDIGRMGAAIFRQAELIGTDQYAVSDSLSGSEMAQVFSQELGITCEYNKVDDAIYQGFGFDKAHELANMFQFKRMSQEFRNNRSVEKANQVMGHQTTCFAQWVHENKDTIPIQKN